MKPLYRPRKWGIESRGWLFLGEQGGPCDKACEFCYYAHQKNLTFYSLQTLFQHANMFRHYYGLDACDITGGEATIFKGIVPLVQHCARIGLRPTIITHGQNIRDDFKLGGKNPLYKEIEAAGLDDWLISLHGGSAASHDAILCQAGSFDRLLHGLDLVQKPVRFNTTLVETNYKDLPVEILLNRPPTVWNPIMFNPFHFWSTEGAQKEIDFQARYDEIGPYLARATERLEAAGWEVNIRYWPLCNAMKHGFEANVSGYHQVPFDPWEWRLNVTARTPLEHIEREGGWYESERKRAISTVERRMNKTCGDCRYQMVCDKPPEQYQKKYGISELTAQVASHDTPVLEAHEADPLVFQRTRGVQA